MNSVQSKSMVIEFPLRGEWYARTSPADRIPSHGTNRMGLQYAFDFLQVDPKHNNKFYSASFLRFLLFGVPLQKFYCWGENIYAPCDGEVTAVVNNVPERKNVHWLRESLHAIMNSFTFKENKHDYSCLAGNYIIMRCTNGIYMAFAHLQTNSVTVAANDKIKMGSLLGKVGHSGNSTSPHLHFQLMDRSDITNAQGIPCQFATYEIYQNNLWKKVRQQIPSSKDRFRYYNETEILPPSIVK